MEGQCGTHSLGFDSGRDETQWIISPTKQNAHQLTADAEASAPQFIKQRLQGRDDGGAFACLRIIYKGLYRARACVRVCEWAV